MTTRTSMPSRFRLMAALEHIDREGQKGAVELRLAAATLSKAARELLKETVEA